MIEFYQLEQFVTIAKEGTLSKAAQRLLISQPALTRSVQRLEEELGIALFDRKKNKITLNDNGILAVELVAKLLTERDQMIHSLQAYDRRKVNLPIGSCAPMPIVGARAVLKKRYPDMQISDTLTSNRSQLLQGLKQHDYSIIILDEEVIEDGFTCVELFKENLYICVPPAHPLALFPEVSFHDLDGESVLLLSHIGFWNEICLHMIPRSHLLIQEDQTVFQELTKASALPIFKSNITLLKDRDDDTRVNIPILDKEAHATYYAIYHTKDHDVFMDLQSDLTNFDWQKNIN